MDEELAADSRKCAVLVCRSCARLCRLMNSVLARTGLNLPQCQLLTVLKESGEITMSELSKRLGVTMGAGTSLVDKVLEAGMVERRRDETDRRLVKVKLTTEGSNALDRDMANLTEFWSGVLDQVDPQERLSFFESYNKLLTLAECVSIEKEGDSSSPA